jgi:hypothetical protein
MLEEQLERVARAGFQLLPAFEIPNHYVLEREGFAVLVERRADGSFGCSGSPGLLREGAFAVLVWRGAEPFFVSKGREEAATAQEVEALRRFDAELREALAKDSKWGAESG